MYFKNPRIAFQILQFVCNSELTQHMENRSHKHYNTAHLIYTVSQHNILANQLSQVPFFKGSLFLDSQGTGSIHNKDDGHTIKPPDISKCELQGNT